MSKSEPNIVKEKKGRRSRNRYGNTETKDSWPFRCKECQTSFKREISYKGHMERHNNSIECVCEICSEKFMHPAYLMKHKRIVHHIKDAYKCETCEKSFTKPTELVQHMTSHTRQKIFQCKECPKYYSTEFKLEKHKKTHDGRYENKFICPTCGEPYKWKSNFQDHLNTHTGENENICDICNEKFQYNRALMTHKRSVHLIKKPYECTKCDKAFKKPSHLMHHVQSHNNERKFKCNICSARFNTSNGRNRHILLHNLSNKKIKCDHCNFRCMMPSQLKEHILKHSEEKSYSCDFCSYRCKQKSGLAYHIRIHTGMRKYKCEECNLTFITSQTLQQHNLKHTAERCYSCFICKKTFKCSRSLKSHQLLHSDFKRYNCQICSKQFRHLSGFTSHQHTHNGTRPYSHTRRLKTLIRKVSRYTGDINAGKQPMGLNAVRSEGSNPFNDHKHTPGDDNSQMKYYHKSTKNLSSKIALYDYITLNRSNLSYECYNCGEYLMSKTSLVCHIRRHFAIADDKFVCGMCNDTFSYESLLIKHMEMCKHDFIDLSGKYVKDKNGVVFNNAVLKNELEIKDETK